MKHESIVVVYDSCQAIAEEIADKLGAETVCVQSLSTKQIENCQSLVLTLEFQDEGSLSPHWQYASQMFRATRLTGKKIAILVALGDKHDISNSAGAFYNELRGKGAHIVGDQLCVNTPCCDLGHWVCTISPNL